MPVKKQRRRKPAAKKNNRSRSKRVKRSRGWLVKLLVLCFLALAGYIIYLDIAVRWKFEGSRWSIPAHVYGRPLELYAGLRSSTARLTTELKLLGYRPVDRPASAGTFSLTGSRFRIFLRAFDFWDGPSESRVVEVRLEGGLVTGLFGAGGETLELVRLEPYQYGSISPSHHEDRSLVQLADVPEALVQALLAIEDRQFYEHVGLDPRGLARALWVNITAGGVVQGGSTLTQQLVKNFYLSQERTLQRKLTEMLMALLLEWHYDKDEILEAYLNEVYLGQSGNRAIHGFGLASSFYFGRPLGELRLQELALLAAMVKGASYYNPFRSPERAKRRRDLVLTEMVEQGRLDDTAAAKAKQAPLGVSRQGALSATEYPAFLDFVRLQLRRDYQEEDLRTEGLHIFTSLDPLVQLAAEQAVKQRLGTIEQARKIKAGSLQAAVLVVRTDNGEVSALVGGRRARYAGFNRALEAERQVGSLVKPAVFLAAIERGYSLASALDDSPLVVKQDGAPAWRPKNYDNKFHGSVRLIDALSYSYNVATVRLGMDIGIERVTGVLRRLGLNRDFRPYPSMLLGAINMTPLEIAQMYLAFASGGFLIPLRTTLSVMNQDMQPLARYPLSLEQVIDGEALTVLNYGLQSVVRKGTARALNEMLSPALKLAGKTGTTDDYRDSWYAGYSGNYLVVVWVGRDDNASMKLTGASGAMLVWADIMAELNPQPVSLPVPGGIEYAEVDRFGLLASGCSGAQTLPFVAGTAPVETASCMPGRSQKKKPKSKQKTVDRLFDGLFGSGRK